MTALWFSGAEQPSHRNLLSDCSVTRYAFNITNLTRIVKKGASWSVKDHLPDGAEWLLYADQNSTWDMAEPFAAQGPSLVLGPQEWSEHFTDPLQAFAPYWEEGIEVSESLSVMGLTDDAVKNQSTLRRILTDFSGTELMAVTGSNRGVDRLDGLVSSAWIAAQRFGETQVWSGNRLHRYAGARKQDVRPKHRADIERLGIDYSLIEADDPLETARLAVVSWQHWETRTTRTATITSIDKVSSTEVYSDQDGTGSAQRSLARGGVRTGHARPTVVLPVLGVDEVTSTFRRSDGTEATEETTALRTSDTSMRQCDSCYLARNCPAFDPGAVCAYSIPLEIKTKDQLQAVMRTMVEIQGQRVLFARFAEEVDGQGIDGVLSQELERFFRILAQSKDISDTRDVLKLEMEARGNSGMLSRLFGSSVGATARQLTGPLESEQVMTIIDAEPV